MSNYKRVFEDGYCYFLTIVTHQRNAILIDNIDLLREAFKHSKNKYPYHIDAIVILPDHIHMIINPEHAIEYPKIVSTMKQYFSKHCDPLYYQHLSQSSSRTKAGYKPIWQKKYYEHTIRNKEDYTVRLNYIHYNPVKHGYVGKVNDWKYSSFQRYVAKGYYSSEWGDFDNKINYE
jgi:putative transposase